MKTHILEEHQEEADNRALDPHAVELSSTVIRLVKLAEEGMVEPGLR
jgi:hypothetical protein